MEHYNLLVTYHPTRAGLAEKEVRKRVEEAGERVEELVNSCISGVFCVEVSGDVKQLVSDIREEFWEDPGMLTHTFHWMPVDRWVKANVEDMTDAARELSEGIEETERWMMHMHKRRHDMTSEELVLALTEPISKGKVDLRNPDKIIAVEVLGGMAGMSLVTRDQVIDANRMRQEIGIPIVY
ncbi:MAG TPA: THUMP domain-containing protein [Methanomassiliicoccaceae archaeon]|nr:THUMP domain-containing protein [Methanomassiliicoccaceae archaeon]HOL07462.1 THUMP domain-containing protein [Methanomassiliicoccaceae archaeon]